MSFIAKFMHLIFGPKTQGLQLRPPWWEISPPHDAALFLTNISIILPTDATLYFEGTLEPRVAELLELYKTSDISPINLGTIWPKSDIYHTTNSAELLSGIVKLIEDGVMPYPSVHFLAYIADNLLIDWYDAFADEPLYVSREIAEDDIKRFADAIKSTYSCVETYN